MQDEIVVGDGAAELHQVRRVAGDLHHLRAGLRRGSRCVDADDSAGAAVLRESHQHTGMRGAGDRADDDIVEPDAELLLLRPHLLGEADVPEPAELVHRGARRDGIGLPALRLHVLDRPLPALPNPDVEALVDQLDLRPHHAAHQDVADPVVDGVLERHPALLHQAALHAELGGDRRDLARVVRLHPSDGDQGIGVRRDGVGHDVLELADLVAAEGEARIAIVALGVELDRAAQMLGEPIQLFDRRRAEGQRIAFELLQHEGLRFSPGPRSLRPMPRQPRPYGRRMGRWYDLSNGVTRRNAALATG